MPDRAPHHADDLLILSEEDVDHLALSSDDVVASVTEVFLAQSRGEVTSVPRTVLGPQSSGRFLAFPGYLPSYDLCGIKWLSIGHVAPDGTPLPFSAQILLNDVATGRLKALVDGRWITLVRTVAVTVIAARVLANPASRCIGFIGCGQQATAHLSSLARYFPLTRVLAVGRSPNSTAAFLNHARTLGLDAAETDIATCLGDSEIIISVVSAHGSSERSTDEALVKPGAFVSLVDLGRLWKSRAGTNRLVVDDREQFEQLAQSGRVQVFGEPSALCEWLAVDQKPAATSQATVFVPTGFGAADLVLASQLVQAAERMGAGKYLKRV